MKANQKKVQYGMAGIGAASHLGGLMLNSMMKVEVLEIPYKGTGPALNDLVSGQFDYMVDQAVNVLAQIKAGNIKALGVSTLKRLPQLPDVPTIDEAGLQGLRSHDLERLLRAQGHAEGVIAKVNQALLADARRSEHGQAPDRTRRRPADAAGGDARSPARPAQGVDRQVGARRKGRRRQAGVDSRDMQTPEGFRPRAFFIGTVSAGRSERRRVGRSQTSCGCDGDACGSSGPTADRLALSKDWLGDIVGALGAGAVPLFD